MHCLSPCERSTLAFISLSLIYNSVLCTLHQIRHTSPLGIRFLIVVRCPDHSCCLININYPVPSPKSTLPLLPNVYANGRVFSSRHASRGESFAVVNFHINYGKEKTRRGFPRKRRMVHLGPYFISRWFQLTALIIQYYIPRYDYRSGTCDPSMVPVTHTGSNNQLDTIPSVHK